MNLLGVDSVEIPLVVKASMWDKLSLQWKLANLDELAHEIGLEHCRRPSSASWRAVRSGACWCVWIEG